MTEKERRLKLLKLMKLYRDKGDQAGVDKIRLMLEGEKQKEPYQPPIPTERHPEVSNRARWHESVPFVGGKPLWQGNENLLRDIFTLAGPASMKMQYARPEVLETVENIATSPTFQMAGSSLAMAPFVSNPAGASALAASRAVPALINAVRVPLSGVLGTGIGESLYQALKGANPFDAASETAKAMAWDTAFIGATDSIPRVWGGSKDWVLRKMLNISPEEAGKWVIKSGNQNIPVGIVDVSRSNLARGFRTVLGKFPILGGPFQRAQKSRSEAATNRLDEILDTIAPVVTANRLGLDIAANAKNTSQELKEFYKRLYNDADVLAIEAGAVVPTDSLKGLAKALREKYNLPKLQETTEQIIPGGRIVDEYGKQVDPDIVKTIITKFEMQKPGDQTVQEFIQQFDLLPQNITVGEVRAIQKTLNSLNGKGFNEHQLGEAKGALEEAILRIDEVNPNINPELMNAITSRYSLANRIFMNTQRLIGNDPNTANPVAQILKRAKVFDGSGRGGGINEDELADLIFKSNSPEAVKQLRSLIGEDVTKQLARRVFDKAVATATKKIPANAMSGESMQIDPEKLRDALGLSVRSKGSREGLEQLLFGTGIKVKDIEEFVDILGTFDNVIVPSMFVARRGIMGGLRGVLTGATGALALGVNPVGAVIGTLLIRKAGNLLNDPQILKDVIKFAQMDPNVNKQAYAQMSARLLRTITTQGSDNIDFIGDIRNKFSNEDNE